jgi:O-methyltransferase involved in polyketide biosynthesis
VARDFSTISPSARQILLVRAQTDLPYAREAAVRMVGEDAVAATGRDIAANPDARLRATHFERRARSIDDAIAARDATLVLELASGFSFRGLELCKRAGACFVDTDLVDVIATKRALVDDMVVEPLAGDYRLVALEATDAAAFAAVVDAMPPGPLTIVNEGLLVYLDRGEKQRLCRTVLGVLRQRGGAWVTADVYVRSAGTMYRDAASRAFLARHDVDNNKFASYAEAEAFFSEQGFAIAARAAPSIDLRTASGGAARPDESGLSIAAGHPRETWTLVPAELPATG